MTDETVKPPTKKEIAAAAKLRELIPLMREAGGSRYRSAAMWVKLGKKTRTGPKAKALAAWLGSHQYNPVKLGMFLKRNIGSKVAGIELRGLYREHKHLWMFQVATDGDEAVLEAKRKGALHPLGLKTPKEKAAEQVEQIAQEVATKSAEEILAPYLEALDNGRTYDGVSIQQPARQESEPLPPQHPLSSGNPGYRPTDRKDARRAEIETQLRRAGIPIAFEQTSLDGLGATSRVPESKGAAVFEILEIDQIRAARGQGLWRVGMSCDPQDYRDYSGQRAEVLAIAGDIHSPVQHDRFVPPSWSPFD